MKPLLKICGVADPAFAAEAARRGVSYIGLIFAAKSPRRIDARRAREIVAAQAAQVPKASFVGVFVEQTVDEIEKIASEVGLDVVQLHGDYADGDVERLKASGLEVWRLLGAGAEPGAEDAVLLDGRDGAKSGGTGKRADWSLVAELKRAGRRVVLAGGISAENANAAAATGADILDANSSLEISPGVKSFVLLDELVRALFGSQ